MTNEMIGIAFHLKVMKKGHFFHIVLDGMQ